MKKLFYIILIGLFFTHHSAHAVQLNSSKGIETFDKKIKVWINFDIQAGKEETKISASVYSSDKKLLLGPEVFIGIDKSKYFFLDTSSLSDNVTYILKVTDNIPQSDTITTNFLNKNSAPNGVKKAESGDFYYTTSYDINAYSSDLHNSFFRFTSMDLCKKNWQGKIDKYYIELNLIVSGRNNYSFTECFELKNIPTEQEFRDKLKPYGTFNSSVDFYYYTWRQADGSWGGSIGYKTPEECKVAEEAETGKGIVIKCKQFNPPPMMPQDWDNNSIDVANKVITPYNSDYHLLAPIGDLNTIDKKTSIGDYLNIIFKIAIGLMGALAVIMIVIHGIQYMGDESVFGKTEAKHSIMTTIGGLLLALCAYALLNTINPDLLGGDGVYVEPVTIITISPKDTSTGSSTSQCISLTNPPNPDNAKGVAVAMNGTGIKKYQDAIKNVPSLPKGIKLLMTAHMGMEGFSPGTRAYLTNNPGNISNVDPAASPVKCSINGKGSAGGPADSKGSWCFDKLEDGIVAQSIHAKMVTYLISGATSYKINGMNKCALGNEKYDGSLYQYLQIYASGARQSNSYTNYVIGYFKSQGVTITARTKMSEIGKIK